jgi:LmbE family N-acetylglucosaminyl deacetylase
MFSFPLQPRSRRGWFFQTGCSVLAGMTALWSPLRSSAESTPNAILQDLRSFQNMGSVLYVAAHPDDENTHLIAYLARGQSYRTAYLSLTRGDGGQNVLGSDLDERLGIARTQELLAARKLDGGRQFFTRAIDFGFSKDYQETLRIWNRQEVLADVVRVIRHFRPDVIITRFSPNPGGTHGHHTSSAILAREAFALAGDARAFPDQLKTLKPWQPKRIFVNGRGGGDGVRLELGGNDPVSGTSLAELAGRSRAMHKTQGFDNFRGGGGARSETLNLLEGEPATNGIMDGVDTTWSRIPGGAEIATGVADAIATFNSNNVAETIPGLLKLRQAVAKLPEDPVIAEKRAQLDRIIAACLGLEVKSVVAAAEVVPGETFTVQHTVSLKANRPVRWVSARLGEKPLLTQATTLKAGSNVVRTNALAVPVDSSLSHPYWLRADRTVGTFRVDNLDLIVEPENPPTFPIQHTFEIEGQRIVLMDEPVQENADVDGGHRPVDVIPPVSLAFHSDVAVFVPGATKEMEVNLTAARENLSGEVRLDLPGGWKASPAVHKFKLNKRGERHSVRFSVTAPREMGSARIVASATVGGIVCRHQRVEVRYGHLPLQLLHPLAAIRAVNMDLAIQGSKVGYIPGAGDDIPAALREMGYEVTVIEEASLTADKLSGLDAVVVGVRAFNVRPKLSDKLPILSRFAEAGGTVIVQYNRQDRNAFVAPFDLRVSGDRVTDENAEVTFLAPEAAVLNRPNKITAADFAGWVQERGLYFPNQWNEKFMPILACNDPGEQPLRGGLLVAPHGKGHLVYTGLSFFRQLPAGVPGAYRLFANLVSLGK